jgi:hypothetical protein
MIDLTTKLDSVYQASEVPWLSSVNVTLHVSFKLGLRFKFCTQRHEVARRVELVGDSAPEATGRESRGG